jgi:hypothetical protein
MKMALLNVSYQKFTLKTATEHVASKSMVVHGAASSEMRKRLKFHVCHHLCWMMSFRVMSLAR